MSDAYFASRSDPDARIFATISYLPEGANPIMNHLTAVLYRKPLTPCSVESALLTIYLPPQRIDSSILVCFCTRFLRWPEFAAADGDLETQRSAAGLQTSTPSTHHRAQSSRGIRSTPKSTPQLTTPGFSTYSPFAWVGLCRSRLT